MRAAILHAYGAGPEVGTFDDPRAESGEVVLDVLAAGVNHLDIARAGGRAYEAPPLPSVVGSDGVGLTHDGRRVYFHKAVAPYGSCSDRTLAEEDELIDVPDGVDDAVAAALGNAGLAALLALDWRGNLQQGDVVLVLGGTGSVGQIAVQLARRLGAGRIVATGRDASGLARLRELGVDVALDTSDVDLDDPQALAEILREAAVGPIDLTVDLLWGTPAVAAIHAAATGARHVQIGSLAGAEASLPAPQLRAKHVSVLGLAGFVTSAAVRVPAYRRLVEYAAAGELVVDVERMPLDRIADAWDRQRRSAHRKLVIIPGAST
jgi:NADPH2:quinone reductase